MSLALKGLDGLLSYTLDCINFFTALVSVNLNRAVIPDTSIRGMTV